MKTLIKMLFEGQVDDRIKSKKLKVSDNQYEAIQDAIYAVNDKYGEVLRLFSVDGSKVKLLSGSDNRGVEYAKTITDAIKHLGGKAESMGYGEIILTVK